MRRQQGALWGHTTLFLSSEKQNSWPKPLQQNPWNTLDLFPSSSAIPHFIFSFILSFFFILSFLVLFSSDPSLLYTFIFSPSHLLICFIFPIMHPRCPSLLLSFFLHLSPFIPPPSVSLHLNQLPLFSPPHPHLSYHFSILFSPQLNPKLLLSLFSFWFISLHFLIISSFHLLLNKRL